MSSLGGPGRRRAAAALHRLRAARGFQGLAVLRVTGRQRAGTVEDLGEHARRGGGKVQDDEHGRGQITGKTDGQDAERLHASRRRAHHDDATTARWSAIHYASLAGDHAGERFPPGIGRTVRGVPCAVCGQRPEASETSS